jgi:hypothetical protein
MWRKEMTYMYPGCHGMEKKEPPADMFVIIALCVCIGIVYACSYWGYHLGYNKGMEHFDKNVKEYGRAYGVKLFDEWRNKKGM